jgi:hypothetical protein
LLQQLFGDRAPYPTDASRRAGDQNWICHFCFLLNASRPFHGQFNRNVDVAMCSLRID